ncbi:recombinase family protein [bacterium]|jgi:DNA invertase Pin-like site-specific DNA recombinase|nr:recombinase family protein [bacterium]
MKNKTVHLWSRVSSLGQSLTYQNEQLLKEYPEGKLWECKISGAAKRKPVREAMLEAIKDGDLVCATRLSRISRNLRDLLGFFEAVEAKGAHIRILNEQIDTSTPSGRLQMHLLSAISEWQREVIRENTASGRKAAIARGVKFGRASKLSKKRIERIRNARTNGKTYRDIAAEESLSGAYVHRLCNPDKNKVYKEDHLNRLKERRAATA